MMQTSSYDTHALKGYFHRLSIQTKLAVIILAASIIVMTLGFVSIIYWEVKSINRHAVEETELATSVLGQDLVRLLLFDSVDVATETVAQLRAFPCINYAVLYDLEGTPVFYYSQDPSAHFSPPPARKEKEVLHHQSSFDVFLPGEYKGTRYGSVYLNVSAEVYRERLMGYVKVITLILPFLLVLSVFISIKFQRVFSAPILRLVQVIKRVSATHDYSQKLIFDEENEIGELYRGFNLLMEQVDFNTRRLQAVKDELEHSNLELRKLNNTLQDQKFAIDQAAKVSITDSDGVITYVNDQFCAMSKYAKEELLGKTYRLVKSGFHTKDFFRDLWTTVAAGRVWKGEIQNRAKDGTYYWVNTTIVPFLDEQGRPIQYLGIHFDITSRKEAERSLRNAKEVAEAAVSSQTEFVKTLSSEVREPMKRLMETLSLLQKENPLEKYHARLDEAVGSADFLLTLFNDVLDYSKILAGRLEFQNIHFNIRSTLDDVVFQCARQAELKNVELLVKSRAGVPLVLQGDPTRLREIIRTFLSMALSFARQGQIHVEVSVQESGSEQAMLRFMMTADTLVLSRDLKSRLEESFNHLDSSIMQVLSGSGIGPSLSKRLIHLLGGEMGIEALPEKGGTLFWFTVKLTVPTHLDSEDQWGRLVSKTGCKVLYCGEDDALFDFLRQQTCHFLGWADHCRKIEEVDERVVNACDESRPYDLVVFDFDLMQSQVLQLAHRLTTNPLTRSVKLVMLSSAAHRGDSDVARQAGFDGYLTKPISSRQLCDSLAMVMDISGDRQDALVTRHVCQELEEVNRKRALVIHHSEAEQARAIVILKSHGIAVDIASGIHEPGMLRGGLRYGLILLEYNPSSPFTVQDINRIRGHFLEGAPIPIIGLFEEKAHLDMLPEEARQLGLEGVIDWPPSEESFSLLIDKWFTS